MKYNLKKIPKGVTIIEGFPSFGLVSTIAIEFLLDHLDAELIGEFSYDNLPATVAIHKGEMIRPMGIWHAKKENLLILHTTLNVQGMEWEVADTIIDLAEKVDANEIISLEGVANPKDDIMTFTYGNEKMKKAGASPLEESIVVGMTAALMLRNDKVTPLFGAAHGALPDAHAAAELVKVLNNYLGLNIDPEPLLKKAEEFEGKLKSIMKQSEEAQKEADRKKLSYLG